MSNKPCACPNQDQSGGKNCCGLQTQTLIRGLLALFFGLLFVGFAYRIVLRMMFFGVGISLLYYGFMVLVVTQVTDYVDTIAARIKRIFWS